MTTQNATELHKLKHRLATERWRRHRAERREQAARRASEISACVAHREYLDLADERRAVWTDASRYKRQRDRARRWAVGLVVGQLLFWLYKAAAQ